MTLRILKKISCDCIDVKDEKKHLHFYDDNNEDNKSLDGTESHVQCQEQFGSEFDLKKYYVHGHDQKDDELI